MEDRIVSVETAELAMKLGFDIETDKGYYKHGSENDFVKLLLWANIEDGKPEFGYAPTQSLLQKWLREKHHKRVEVKSYFVTELMFFVSINTDSKDYQFDKEFLTYEEALEFGLFECLQIVSETVV